jgi:EAL domain-containing protein (putative c-di-GMP-specific phosphodiesterase class I)
MKKVFLIEDNEDDFNSFLSSYKELGFNVFPSSYGIIKNNCANEVEFTNFVIKNIIYEEISFISIDLNLKDFGFGDKTQVEEKQTGINIIKEISRNSIYSVRNIPILILSKFDPEDIERNHYLSKYIISYIHKDQIGERSLSRKFPLHDYLSSFKYLEKITTSLDRFNHFLPIQFNSIFGDELELKDLMTLKNTLLNAIKNNKVLPSYQKITNHNKEKEKYEVLARVETIDDSFYKFLSVSNFFGLLSDVTNIIIEKSLFEIKNTRNNISININYEDLIDDKFICLKETLEKHVNSNSLNNEQITLEILEGAEHNKTILLNIKELKELGFLIAIDDFGLKNSNFERLMDFIDNDCINFLKIDGKFIKNICESKISENIVKSIISIADEHNIKVVVEYIADERIFNFCKELSENLLYQGFYLHKPSLNIK